MKLTALLVIVGVLFAPTLSKHLSQKVKDKLKKEKSATSHIELINKDVGADIKEHLYQSDIKLTEEQSIILSGEQPPKDSMSKRNGIRSLYSIWRTKKIPYEFDASIVSVSGLTTKIQSAIQVFASKTCINWVPRNGEAKFVRFVRKDGCWSYVGMTYETGAQELSIGLGCESEATILHEMMHAAGFFHEQARPDRDNYVIVNYANIVDGMASQFDKQTLSSVDTRGLPYDFGSVMHYGNKDFSKNGLPTLQAKYQTNLQLGQEIGLSALDVDKLNAHYDCSAAAGEVFSSWAGWGPCKLYVDYNACWEYRQRFCTVDSISSCQGADQYGIHTEWRSCTCPT